MRKTVLHCTHLVRHVQPCPCLANNVNARSYAVYGQLDPMYLRVAGATVLHATVVKLCLAVGAT